LKGFDVSFQTIMVHLEPDQAAFRRLGLARGVAEWFQGRLIGISAVDAFALNFTPGAPPAALFEKAEQELELSIEGLKGHFERAASPLPTEWRSALAAPTAFVADNARAADLVVVGRTSESGAQQGFALNTAGLVLTAGRPVMVVPPDVERLSGTRVLVAWKSGRHARLAVQQALPLLKRAEEVSVVGVGDETDPDELEDVCAYLTGHGCSAKAKWMGPGSHTVAHALVGAASEMGSDLIVCGGYGHGRAAEWVMGGVTEDLLKASPVCCLMSH
jgi:nucleotide-binding universal stress UspA family protein